MTNKRIELNPISISYILQPNGVNLSYFKIWQFDLAKFLIQHWVANLKDQKNGTFGRIKFH